MASLRRSVALCALTLGLCSCAVREDVDPTSDVGAVELAAMVLPKSELGQPDALRLDRESGPRDNATAADDSLPPNDTAAAMRRAGRVDGFELGYHRRGGRLSDRRGLLHVSTAVERFRAEDAAERYLHDQMNAFELWRGKEVGPGVVLARAERFAARDVREGARGVSATVRFGKRRLTGTVVAFQRGHLVGTVTMMRVDASDVSGWAKLLAKRLDARITRALAGEIDPRSLDAPWASDPERHTPRADDFPELRLDLAHAGSFDAKGRRTHFREFDVVRGAIAGSSPFYVRTLGESFPSARAARADLAYMRTAKGARTIAARYLRGLFGKTSFRPAEVATRPLPWSGDTAGMQIFFDAPRGRLEIAMLNVAQGHEGVGVTIMGRAAEIDPRDLLRLRPRLRAILADG